jgi:hypothetical protein
MVSHPLLIIGLLAAFNGGSLSEVSVAAAGHSSTPTDQELIKWLERPSNLPFDLYQRLRIPSGRSLCSLSAAQRQQRRFVKKFGQRIYKLAQVIVANEGDGWPKDFVIVGGCFSLSPRRTREEVNKFELYLNDLENRYKLNAVYPLDAGMLRMP